MKIGLFDSGIGGLNVLKELLKVYPNNEYIYYGDTLNVPYGDKSKEEILKLSKKIVDFLDSMNVDLIIVACGTVSSNVFEELKKIVKVPIYDIISPTINYIKRKNYNGIGVFATSATVKSKVFSNNLDNSVIEIECPLLVPLIENNSISELEKVTNNYLKKIDNEIDALVLGCTHYPIIKDIIKNKMNVEIIDMGKILVDSLNISSGKTDIDLYFSKETDKLKENIYNILENNIDFKIVVL